MTFNLAGFPASTVCGKFFLPTEIPVEIPWDLGPRYIPPRYLDPLYPATTTDLSRIGVQGLGFGISSKEPGQS